MEKIKSIAVELDYENDFNTVKVEYEDGSSSSQGGGNIYEAFIDAIAEVDDKLYLKRYFGRLSTQDREYIARKLRTCINEIETDVKYLMDNFYETKD